MSGGPAPLPLIPYPGWLHASAGGSAPARFGSGGTGAAGSATNPLTSAQAQALFTEMAALPNVPFNYPDDGCYARAHEMYFTMKADGVEAGKAWNYGSKFESSQSTLKVSTPYNPNGEVTWRYHVAPSVWVQDGAGGAKQMVIDPSIAKGPIPAVEWQQKQGDATSRLEFSGGDVFYKTPDNLPDGTPATSPYVDKDDNRAQTKEVLKEMTERRDERQKLHPELFEDKSGPKK
ncbi:MAG TPA: protein-glutamine glutaminase family protein [Vicinamibacteria bacterium]|nr:protein-glutamine glutaminase family protein [Vicinamibacteria bacterium]